MEPHRPKPPWCSLSSKRPSFHFQRQPHRCWNSQIWLFWAEGLAPSAALREQTPLGSALASPSTLNTPLHTLNCMAFASIRNRKRSREHLAQRSWSARRLTEQSRVHEPRLEESDSEKVNLCAAAAPIINIHG